MSAVVDLWASWMGSTVARKSGLALGLPGSGERRSLVSFMKIRERRERREMASYLSVYYPLYIYFSIYFGDVKVKRQKTESLSLPSSAFIQAHPF
jgi:hypothetical protein